MSLVISGQQFLLLLVPPPNPPPVQPGSDSGSGPEDPNYSPQGDRFMKRADILNHLRTKLQEITIENGYFTDLGLNTHYFRELSFEDGERGALSFSDPSEEMSDTTPVQLILSVELTAIKFTLNPFVDLQHMLSDLLNAVTGENWEGVAQRTQLVSSEKRIKVKGRPAGFVKLLVKIHYTE